jgi:hypothetical protein
MSLATTPPTVGRSRSSSLAHFCARLQEQRDHSSTVLRESTLERPSSCSCSCAATLSLLPHRPNPGPSHDGGICRVRSAPPGARLCAGGSAGTRESRLSVGYRGAVRLQGVLTSPGLNQCARSLAERCLWVSSARPRRGKPSYSSRRAVDAETGGSDPPPGS